VRPRTVGLLLAGVSLACAAGPQPAALAPADLAALAEQVAQHPDDPVLNLRLAKAYYATGRFVGARRAVAVAVAANPANGEAQVYLGLSYEGLAYYDSARAVYNQLLASQVDGRTRRLLSGRLAILARVELQRAAREAIAGESLLAQTPPDPNTVAVMPFRYVGSDTTYRPLERGLAALVVTDLSRVRRLRLVERARVQLLLDELKLAETGRVDPATGARSGRLVGAAEVVEGQFATGPRDQVRLDATVVRAADAQIAAAGSNADALRALFDVEKAVVLELLDKLGISLTPGERVAISERPTRDLAAFLLYSRGLEAEDRGDFAAAAQAFQQAAQRDPAFREASEQAATNEGAQTMLQAPATELAVAAGGGGPSAPIGGAPAPGTLLSAVNGAVPTGASTLQAVATTSTSVDAVASSVSAPTIAIALPPAAPNLLCEVKCDGPAFTPLIGTVIIIIKRP
jgi:tetratricopeptide (TPR) repeat protein